MRVKVVGGCVFREREREMKSVCREREGVCAEREGVCFEIERERERERERECVYVAIERGCVER